MQACHEMIPGIKAVQVVSSLPVKRRQPAINLHNRILQNWYQIAICHLWLKSAKKDVAATKQLLSPCQKAAASNQPPQPDPPQLVVNCDLPPAAQVSKPNVAAAKRRSRPVDPQYSGTKAIVLRWFAVWHTDFSMAPTVLLS